MKTKSFDKKSAALAICGIVGPITYAVVLTVIGMLWEGYNPVRQGMSELGAANAPHSFFMNVFGFQLLGVCMAAFGYGLHRQIKGRWFSKIGTVLIIIGGIDMIVVGFFQQMLEVLRPPLLD